MAGIYKNQLNKSLTPSIAEGFWGSVLKRIGLTTVVGLGALFAAAAPMSAIEASAGQNRQTVETAASIGQAVQQKLPDGVYLYGQSPQPNQLGAAYMVFQVQNNRVIGAFFMPHSSFDCFDGEFQAERLALSVVDSYERTVHPFSVALGTNSSVATTGEAAIPVSLEGFHRINTVSENDQRILSTCQADFQQRR